MYVGGDVAEAVGVRPIAIGAVVARFVVISAAAAAVAKDSTMCAYCGVFLPSPETQRARVRL